MFIENLGRTLFLLYINNLPDDAICNIAIYACDTTLLWVKSLFVVTACVGLWTLILPTRHCGVPWPSPNLKK